MSGLATAEYWDDYYRQSPHTTFDWYLPNRLTLHRITTQLRSLAHTHNLTPHSLHLLQVGCGSSALTAELVAAGYTQLTNIDFSPNIVHTLQTQQQSNHATAYPSTVTFHCMDARSLTLPAGTFHFVLDKGTLDCCALSTDCECESECEEGCVGEVGWSVSGGRMLDEVCRVLRPGGVLMCFSVHGYEARMNMMEETEVDEQEVEGGQVKTAEESKEELSESQQEGVAKVGSGRRRVRRGWDVQYHTLAGPLEMPEQQHSYLYICTKWQHNS